jgi:hypothetical protein
MARLHQCGTDRWSEEACHDIGRVKAQKDLGTFGAVCRVCDHDMRDAGQDRIAAANEEERTRQPNPADGEEWGGMGSSRRSRARRRIGPFRRN